MKKLFAQFMKFGVVGVLAFALDYGLLAFFTEILGIDYLLSATLSYIISTVFNYLASMRFVFRHRENMSRTREFVLFFIGSLIGLGINDGCMWLGVELLGVHYLITKLFATFVVAIWNFVTRKIFLDADRETPES
ncbi:MAG: GtrA family protein [Eggerthellaceae bacterium]|nr:GtrA family protein [Eggerthellaceae bacterium]